MSCLLFLTACAHLDSSNKILRPSESKDDKTVESIYADETMRVMEQVEIGSVYEITPNKFIKGLNLDLTKRQLRSLKRVAKNITFDDINVAEEDAVKYRVRLYDKEGGILFDFGVQENDEVWCKGKRIRDAEPFLEWLGKLPGVDAEHKEREEKDVNINS